MPYALPRTAGDSSHQPMITKTGVLQKPDAPVPPCVGNRVLSPWECDSPEAGVTLLQALAFDLRWLNKGEFLVLL